MKKQESSMGTAIAIAYYLKPYIHNIITLPSTIIAIDLFLPHNTKVRIISIYIPTNDLTLQATTHLTLTKWISQANSKGLQLIILGDFNSNINRQDNTSKLLKKLQQLGLQSLLQFF